MKPQPSSTELTSQQNPTSFPATQQWCGYKVLKLVVVVMVGGGEILRPSQGKLSFETTYAKTFKSTREMVWVLHESYSTQTVRPRSSLKLLFGEGKEFPYTEQKFIKQ